MSGTKKALDLSAEFLETFLLTIKEDEKEIVRQIVKRFEDCGLPIKTKQYDQPCMEGTFRILCFIKKSAEAVIINNKGMGREGVSIQVRINDKGILDRLDDLSENVRNQILNSGNCRNCSSKCENKKYSFKYQKKAYLKCHFICNNFFFQNLDKNDIKCLLSIIKNEINYRR